MRKIEEIVVATANQGKVRELVSILEEIAPLRVLSLADFPGIEPPEETGETFRDNAVLKAVYYSKLTGMPCIAEDSGLVVDALGGAPGIYSSRYAGPGATDEENMDRLLIELSGRPEPWNARFVCYAACVRDGEVLAEAEGTLEGRIIPEKRGAYGFGYDPVFYLEEFGKTVAEISLEEKNAISHRRKAFQKLFGTLREKGLL